MRGPRRRRIDDDADRGALRAVAHERMRHAHRIGIAACSGIVLGVGDHDGFRRGCRQRHRLAHALVGLEDAAVERCLARHHPGRDDVGRAVGIGLRRAIGQHRRPAIGEVGRREAGQEGEARHAVALQRGELGIDRLARLHRGRLPGDRDQIGDLPERLGGAFGRSQQPGEAGRGAAAGLRHVDMRIGAVGDERVGALDHQPGDVAVEVEARDERHVRPDRGAHAPEHLAFAVIEAFADHGAVQVEINPVERQRGRDARDQIVSDRLERLCRDMGRGAGCAPQRRQQGPAGSLARLDEARCADIDVVHAGEDVLAPRQRRPAAALDEGVHAGLARREGVGLVQEAAEGYTRHGNPRRLLQDVQVSTQAPGDQGAFSARWSPNRQGARSPCRKEDSPSAKARSIKEQIMNIGSYAPENRLHPVRTAAQPR